MRIFQYLQLNKQATTSEISQELSNVPIASLYRHINKMVTDGILEIITENKIRGVYEKVYKIAQNPLEAIEKDVENKDRDALYNACYQFSVSLLSDFAAYLKNDEIDLHEDRVGFRSFPMNLSGQESDAFIGELYEVIQKYSQLKANEERPLRKFSFTFMPLDEKE